MQQEPVTSPSASAEKASPAPQPPAPGQPVPTWRRALTALGLVMLVGSAAFGGNLLGIRERFLGSETPEAKPAAPSRDAVASPVPTPQKTVLRSAPWWQRVTTLQGTGPTTTPSFAIDGGAIQWRIKWSCQSGHMVVQAPHHRRALVDAGCPRSDAAYSTRTGAMSLDVRSDGPWQMEIEQQLDIPLNEPPLPAMTAPGAKPIATGSLYRIDQVGSGNLTFYRLADGSHALRLDNIYVSPNTDLEILLSQLPEPKTTEQFLSAPSALVGRLDVTAGSMNFVLPKEVDPRRYRSLVVWCPPIRSAYAGAALRPAQ